MSTHKISFINLMKQIEEVNDIYFKSYSSIFHEDTNESSHYHKFKSYWDRLNKHNDSKYAWKELFCRRKNVPLLNEFNIQGIVQTHKYEINLLNWLYHAIYAAEWQSNSVNNFGNYQDETEKLKKIQRHLNYISQNISLILSNSRPLPKYYKRQDKVVIFSEDEPDKSHGFFEIEISEIINDLKKTTKRSLSWRKLADTTIKNRITKVNNSDAVTTFFVRSLNDTFLNTFNQSMYGTIANITNAIFELPSFKKITADQVRKKLPRKQK